MKKNFLLPVIGIVTVTAAIMIWLLNQQVEEEKKRSDDILQQFKQVDEHLQQSIDSLNKEMPGLTDTIHP